LSDWTDRPIPRVTRKPRASAAVHRWDLLEHGVLDSGCSRRWLLSMPAVGLDGLDERITFLVMGVEELLDRKGHVAVPIGDQTTHELALRVEVGRNES
jgi:hypothetical protein